ncbi:MAG: tetratricopeptide repeat protein [Bacteroidales bacterium]|nr:tetratricopeptide repeat protein [Bacteroidales bacterium]
MKRILFTGYVLISACILSGQSPDHYYLKGMAALQQNQPEAAVQALNDAIGRNNSDERYYLCRADAYYRLGKFDLAASDYDEAGSIMPGCGDLGLARVYAATGEAEKSIDCLKRHLRSDYRLSATTITKDLAFSPLHGMDEWHDLWQQDWYSDIEKAEAEVEYYLKKKDAGQALEFLNGKMTSFQKEARYYALRAGAYFVQENYAAAVADYSMALSLNKTEPDYYFSRGLAFLRSERYKDAIDDFTKGLRYEPSRFAFYLERAKANAGLYDYKTAAEDIEFYLGFFDGDQDAIALCGEMYFQYGDYINALKCFNKNLKADPNNPAYYKARGKTYVKTGTIAYGINDLSMSLDLKPDDGETWLYLGLAKYEMGDREAACSNLKKAQHYGNTLAVKYIVEYCIE